MRTTESAAIGNSPAIANCTASAHSLTGSGCGCKQHLPTPMSGVFYGECIKNYSYKFGVQVLDGCRKFTPSDVDICVCGCPRTDHHINLNSSSFLIEDVYGECLKNHGAIFGSHVLDGCKKFFFAYESCNCGCPRIMHHIYQNPDD